MTLSSLATTLRDDARRGNERRLLVLAGDRNAGYDAAIAALDAAAISREATAAVGVHRDVGDVQVDIQQADRLLGTTFDAVVLDLHDSLRPNAIGSVVGAVDGGGLFVLLTPPLAAWPSRRDEFDERLAVPPFTVEEVTGRFKQRFVDTLRVHDGVAIYDVDTDTIVDAGDADRVPPHPVLPPTPKPDAVFPFEAYRACITRDQADALAAFESLTDPGTAVVVEADRGRGKSAAAGLAAACLANDGAKVLVTAPAFRNAEEVFVRARALYNGDGSDRRIEYPDGDRIDYSGDGRIEYPGDGRIEFLPPETALEQLDVFDVVFVDEAAAFPVHRLEAFLAADRVGFTTTVHGYEGAGRGFSVRFRDRLTASTHTVIDARMDEPIRYAAGDPVEIWAFRALLLDAHPPVDPVVEDSTPDSVTYRSLDQEALARDERLLRETFGSLVLAHYRTEPDDLARLLDAPNVSVRALMSNDHVVSVALLAREGGLSDALRAHMYEGGRVTGNMLPDVLTSQLRDETAGDPVGYRVLRIATHHAVRSRGLGSRLLDAVNEEFTPTVDWLAAGYGATPELLSFWAANDYRTVHLSTTRNDTSGEYSAIMLNPTSPAGHTLHDRHATDFVHRIGSVLADPLRDADPDVVRAALATVDTNTTIDTEPTVDLTDREWTFVADAAYGPGLFDVAPAPFRQLAVSHLVERTVDLTDREERLLVRKVLQATPWPAVARELDYPSTRQAMRALGDTYATLLSHYGGDVAARQRRRFE